MSDLTLAPVADQSRYSLHPEEDVTETCPHRHQVVYLETNLRATLRDRFVGANLGVYWVPGQFEEPWVGPDVLVSQPGANRTPRRVYLAWEHGPIAFVAEVASEKTRLKEPEKREQRYQRDLAIPESLYMDLERPQLELWRLHNGVYRRVRAAANGRLYSQELNLWFGWDPVDEFVRIWTPDGRMLRTKEEDLEHLEAVERRAREAEAAREAAREAEERSRERATEAELGREAAREQAREAEARAAELASEVERLRRLLDAAGRPENRDGETTGPGGS